MSTSGTVSYSITATQIITAALTKINATPLGQATDGNDWQYALGELNRIVKDFENQAQHIWERKEAVLFPQPGQASYTLGPGSTDMIAAGSYTQTNTTATAAASATFVNVTSLTGLTIGDNFGIVLDSGSIYWTTIASFGTLQVNLVGSLPSQATSGNLCFDFTTAITKPLEVPQMRYRNTTSQIDVPMINISYDKYQSMPNKTTSPSTSLMYSFQRSATNSTIFLWPVPANTNFIFPLTYTSSIQDFTNPADAPDLPQEWFHYMVHELAVCLCPAYGRIGDDAYKALVAKTEYIKQGVLSYDNETAPVDIMPNRYMS